MQLLKQIKRKRACRLPQTSIFLVLTRGMQLLMKLLKFCDCCIQKSSESYRQKLMKPQQLFRRLLLTQRQTTDWGRLEDEHFRISASHLLNIVGNHVSFGMCVEVSCFQGKNPRKLTMFQRFTIIAFTLIKLGRRKKKKEMPMLLFSPVPPVSSDLLRSRD